jgi:ADP-ribose pyrophosphatase
VSDSLPHWERQARKTVYDTKYTKVYEDTVLLPNGTVIDDFSVVSFPNGVTVVATDENDQLITMLEYKYAVDDVVLNLPAGSIEPGEEPVDVARRELREEAGYESDELELVKTLYNDYPSKATHLIYIVRAKNARKVGDPKRESTETMGEVRLISADTPNYGGEFNTAYAVAALSFTLPEYLKR